MLIIEIKENENIDKALKRFKKKFEKTQVLKELRRRQAFIKPSVEKRDEVKKAVYINDKYGVTSNED
ncbi:MAG: 30S ribosomal protein S21 [Cytophagales bacterium]